MLCGTAPKNNKKENTAYKHRWDTAKACLFILLTGFLGAPRILFLMRSNSSSFPFMGGALGAKFRNTLPSSRS